MVLGFVAALFLGIGGLPAVADVTGSGPGYSVDWVSWNTGTRFESRLRSGLCAEIGASSTAQNVALSQWPCAGVNGSLGGGNQIWESTATDTFGKAFFRNALSRLCLAPGGVQPVQVSCEFSGTKRWTVLPTDSGYFRLQSSTGTCVGVPAATNHGATLVLTTCAATSTEWKVRDGGGMDLYGFTNFSQTIRPVKTPSGHFWSVPISFVNQLATPTSLITGGYLGIQTNSPQGFAKAAVFSIWGGSIGDQIAAGGICRGWDDAIPPASGEGGYGMSCVVPYTWNDGGAYNMTMNFSSYGNGPQTYNSGGSIPGKYFVAAINGTTIARIFVPGTHRSGTLVHLIASRNSSFSEHFGPSICGAFAVLDVTFDPPYFSGGTNRSTVDSDPTNRVGPDTQCGLAEATQQTWNWDPAKNSLGSVRLYK